MWRLSGVQAIVKSKRRVGTMTAAAGGILGEYGVNGSLVCKTQGLCHPEALRLSTLEVSAKPRGSIDIVDVQLDFRAQHRL